jgi:LuxR family quorum-sensing transcriptional regulator LasR
MNQLTEAANFDEWFKQLNKLAGTLGFSRILFGLKCKTDTSFDSAIIHSSYSEAWRLKYDREGYAYIDPVVAHSFKSNVPLIWGQQACTQTQEYEFFEEASMYGLQQGLTLPLHAVNGYAGMFSLSNDHGNDREQLAQIQQTLPHAAILRDFALESAAQLLGKADNSSIHLTKRELEVLKWGAAGKTTWETSMILACSEAAIDFHFKNIRKKFKVSSRRTAIVKAIQQNLITP